MACFTFDRCRIEIVPIVVGPHDGELHLLPVGSAQEALLELLMVEHHSFMPIPINHEDVDAGTGGEINLARRPGRISFVKRARNRLVVHAPERTFRLKVSLEPRLRMSHGFELGPPLPRKTSPWAGAWMPARKVVGHHLEGDPLQRDRGIHQVLHFLVGEVRHSGRRAPASQHFREGRWCLSRRSLVPRDSKSPRKAKPFPKKSFTLHKVLPLYVNEISKRLERFRLLERYHGAGALRVT